ncbi:MAG: hypothetical protein ABWY50_01745 [Aeromicrobium sp.]
MTDDLQLGPPTVTMFGTRDALDTALSDELERRGRSTHVVTTPVGWLKSVTHAVIRVDSAAGERALRDLAMHETPPAQVVAVCETPLDDETSARLDRLCRECGVHHEISLIWHPPFEVRLTDSPAGSPLQPVLAPDELAVTIADAVGDQESHASTPAFASQVFDPHGAGRAPGHV